MRLVSEQSEAEVGRHRALDQLTPALRHLTANLMRITRGAGHPYRLAEELTACLSAMRAYQEAVGYGPSTEEIQAALDASEPEVEYTEAEIARRYESGTWAREQALTDIRRAGLGMTAALLLNQRLQMSKAEADMRSATDRLEEAHNALRKFRAPPPAPPPQRQRRKKSA